MRSLLVVCIVVAVFMPFFAHALIATSTSFRIIEPVIQVLGGFASSTTYQLNQSVAQLAIGTSSVTSSFQVSSGFLYYPFATRPVVTPTAGDASVALSWVASPSQGFLGWNVSGYNVGQSTTLGGPYTYSASLGNVTSSTRTGLSNGTIYYFVVRAEDAFQNSIATSTEVSATPVAGAAVSETTPSSAGGNGPIIDLILLITGVPTVIPEEYNPETPLDLNGDGKVNISDFSIFLYLQSQPSPNRADFNDDLQVNLQDLSALFSAWTERVLTFVPEGTPRAVVEEGRVTRRDTFAAVGEAVGKAETGGGDVFPDATGQGRRFLGVFFDFLGRLIVPVLSFVSRLFGRIFGW